MADFLNINEVLNHLDVKKSDVAAEFGCGSGEFALALAKKVDKGKLYALDIQPEKISALKNRIDLLGQHNIRTILCDLESEQGSTLKNNFLDIVVIPNLLFQAENKYGIIQEAKRVLKNKGQLLIIDWLKSSVLGPKENLIKPQEVKKMAEELDFLLKKEFASGDYHYALLFVKK